MGTTTFKSTDWTAYAKKNIDGKQASQIFSSGMIETLDPTTFKMRESRDSTFNPNSNAILIGLDVTGSMGRLAEVMVRQGMKTVFTEIYDKKPVTDPHVAFAAIGDMYTDLAPLQMTQFEAGVELAEQLSNIYLEGHGGGNGGESYPGLWLLAAMKTSIDCYEKRGKKGFLFTVGDECPHNEIPQDQIARFIDRDAKRRTISAAEALALAQRTYNVYHIVIDDSPYVQRNHRDVYSSWRNLLGENVISLSDHTKLAELIVSILRVAGGHDVDSVVKSWSGDTSLVVANAIKGLQPTRAGQTGLVRF